MHAIPPPSLSFHLTIQLFPYLIFVVSTIFLSNVFLNIILQLFIYLYIFFFYSLTLSPSVSLRSFFKYYLQLTRFYFRHIPF